MRAKGGEKIITPLIPLVWYLLRRNSYTIILYKIFQTNIETHLYDFNSIQIFFYKHYQLQYMPSEDELRKKAEKRAEERLGFYIHLGIYAIVNLFLIAIWWFTGGIGTFPWFIFPLFGWGIGIVAHFIAVYISTNLMDKMAEKELEKLKNK